MSLRPTEDLNCFTTITCVPSSTVMDDIISIQSGVVIETLAMYMYYNYVGEQG